ncbi:expressed unknown protein [Ectocarpus siliculosus]|uniref:Uncharacterized protein n=1 Tax=Ectocarpus siliculosus TaxID=2880 RepID=D7G0Z6_ECTSI|nr:expressed unknown protein [Ectocarpus siliculosus]|eukprot:CBJ33106.1 expressed unknown protein [Ectocarpus siliculosus]
MSVPWPHVVLFASVIMIMSCGSLPGCCVVIDKARRGREGNPPFDVLHVISTCM